jgi:hypothetical protein
LSLGGQGRKALLFNLATPLSILAFPGAIGGQADLDPATHKRLVDLSQDIYPPDQQSPEALKKPQQAEMDKWWPIIKAADIRAQ